MSVIRTNKVKKERGGKKSLLNELGSFPVVIRVCLRLRFYREKVRF
jgi:hypothetical protein